MTSDIQNRDGIGLGINRDIVSQISSAGGPPFLICVIFVVSRSARQSAVQPAPRKPAKRERERRMLYVYQAPAHRPNAARTHFYPLKHLACSICARPSATHGSAPGPCPAFVLDDRLRCGWCRGLLCERTINIDIIGLNVDLDSYHGKGQTCSVYNVGEPGFAVPDYQCKTCWDASSPRTVPDDI